MKVINSINAILGSGYISVLVKDIKVRKPNKTDTA